MQSANVRNLVAKTRTPQIVTVFEIQAKGNNEPQSVYELLYFNPEQQILPVGSSGNEVIRNKAGQYEFNLPKTHNHFLKYTLSRRVTVTDPQVPQLLEDIPHNRSVIENVINDDESDNCLLYTSPSPRDS